MDGVGRRTQEAGGLMQNFWNSLQFFEKKNMQMTPPLTSPKSSSHLFLKSKNTENWYGNLRILTKSESIGNISYIHFQSLALLIL